MCDMDQRDTCGMVYYCHGDCSYYFTHREGDTYLVVHRYECGLALHPAVDTAFPNRSEAQAALDRIAAKRNMIREPQYAGRWS